MLIDCTAGFQFLIGRLKTFSDYGGVTMLHVFQFLIGRLKTHIIVAHDKTYSSFNSL